MTELNEFNHQPTPDDNSAHLLSHQAKQASTDGHLEMAAHLYMAAFDAGFEEGEPSQTALKSIREAWNLACSTEDRTLAEHVFQKMEPYLSPVEAGECGKKLRDLAFSHLETLGLDRAQLEEFAEAMESGFSAGPEPTAIFEGSGFMGAAFPLPGALGSSGDEEEGLVVSEAGGAASGGVLSSVPATGSERLTLSKLVGYREAKENVISLGVGRTSSEDYRELIEELNKRHGVSNPPAMDALLIRADAREDALRFAQAVAGESGRPLVRMRMDDGPQGLSVLSLTIQGSAAANPSKLTSVLERGGVLLLEDLDLWEPPYEEPFEDFGGFIRASVGRGARDVMDLIRRAVEHPSVTVIATVSRENSIDAFFIDLVTPFTVVEIDLPTAAERDDIWAEIAREHPSIRNVDRADLVRFTNNMPRYDIYMAATEAVEEAYREAVALGQYVPVSAANVFEKIAAYQPLESEEYQALEQAVVESFREDLVMLEDIFGDE